MAKNENLTNREISWLSFNERVLQEAEDPTTPLVERMRFLGIFSNNRDEFFRVRVATVRRMLDIGKRGKEFLGEKPKKVFEKIQEITLQQEKRFEAAYQVIIKELEKEKIFLVPENKLNKSQGVFVRQFFTEKVRPLLIPVMISQVEQFPYLKDSSIYLAIKLSKKDNPKDFKYSLIEVPTNQLSRFLVLPDTKKGPTNRKAGKSIILLDDVIRYCLDEIFYYFHYDKIEAHTIKLSRSAELELDEDDFSKSFVEKLKKSLKKRKKGDPIRFIYDNDMPKDLYHFIKEKMGLDAEDNLIPGGKYHNFKDFMGFPNVGSKKLEYPKQKPLKHPAFHTENSIFDELKQKDIMVHYPYQSFAHIIDFLREAAIDEQVKSIKITLYRVANHSNIINALINAARNGKKVSVLLEIKARFDEEANIYWSNVLMEENVDVIFSFPELKVHSKLCVVNRQEGKKLVSYANIATGNYHEGNAKVYADESLLTANEKITKEVNKVFDFLENQYKSYRYSELIVAPFTLRKKLMSLINNEIKNAKKGKKAELLLKMNSLSDSDMISKLYEASQAGVKVTLIVRGICCLQPGIKDLSENITVVSIVDKYLEHSRIYVFCNGGNELYYIASADLMTRNLNRRVEIMCPIYDKSIQKDLKKLLQLQLNDNVKARIIDKDLSNEYKSSKSKTPTRAQVSFYEYLKRKTLKEGE